MSKQDRRIARGREADATATAIIADTTGRIAAVAAMRVIAAECDGRVIRLAREHVERGARWVFDPEYAGVVALVAPDAAPSQALVVVTLTSGDVELGAAFEESADDGA